MRLAPARVTGAPETPRATDHSPTVRHGRATGNGAYRARTDDPLLAKQVLSQLS